MWGHLDWKNSLTGILAHILSMKTISSQLSTWLCFVLIVLTCASRLWETGSVRWERMSSRTSRGTLDRSILPASPGTSLTTLKTSQLTTYQRLSSRKQATFCWLWDWQDWDVSILGKHSARAQPAGTYSLPPAFSHMDWCDGLRYSPAYSTTYRWFLLVRFITAVRMIYFHNPVWLYSLLTFSFEGLMRLFVFDNFLKLLRSAPQSMSQSVKQCSIPMMLR